MSLPMEPLFPVPVLISPADRLEFEVHGIPQPKGSTRAFKRGDKIVTTSDNPRLKGWAGLVIDAASEAFAGRQPFDDPLRIGVTFILPRPAGHFGKRGLLPSARLYPTALPDLDKLIRGLLDGITQAGVWRDDSRVVDIRAVKVYGDAPGARVSVRVLR